MLPLLMRWGYVNPLVRQDLSQPALQPPLELCIQLRLLLPVPAEVMTRYIRWWQRAGRVTQGRVILSRQLVNRVILAETRVV